MAYRIEVIPKAVKQIEKLDKEARERILSFISGKLPTLENPRSLGSALKGDLSDFWKYRVGDYRVLCRIEDDRIVILVVHVGHRREVYRK
jgi:mRNA interferase RelE/StbE